MSSAKAILSQRKDYLDGRVTFEEFCRSVYREAGLTISDKEFLSRVRNALTAGDKHLNGISLSEWDMRALQVQAQISRSLKKHSDFWSLAGGVCTMKQLARDSCGELPEVVQS